MFTEVNTGPQSIKTRIWANCTPGMDYRLHRWSDKVYGTPCKLNFLIINLSIPSFYRVYNYAPPISCYDYLNKAMIRGYPVFDASLPLVTLE